MLSGAEPGLAVPAGPVLTEAVGPFWKRDLAFADCLTEAMAADVMSCETAEMPLWLSNLLQLLYLSLLCWPWRKSSLPDVGVVGAGSIAG